MGHHQSIYFDEIGKPDWAWLNNIQFAVEYPLEGLTWDISKDKQSADCGLYMTSDHRFSNCIY